MDKTQKQIQELKDQMEIFKGDLKALTNEVYRNNFSSRQDFTKFSTFSTRLKIPHYDSAPPIGEVGELIEIGGILFICSSPNTFTIV